MNGKSILELLKHFNDAELDKMKVFVRCGKENKSVGVDKLQLVCEEGHPALYNVSPVELKLLIISD